MRSEVVHQAVTSVPNRFLLTHVASKITRAFHRPKQRLSDSINQSLGGLAEGKYFVRRRGLDWSGDLVHEITGAPSDLTAITSFLSLTTGIPYFPPQSETSDAVMETA